MSFERLAARDAYIACDTKVRKSKTRASDRDSISSGRGPIFIRTKAIKNGVQGGGVVACGRDPVGYPGRVKVTNDQTHLTSACNRRQDFDIGAQQLGVISPLPSDLLQPQTCNPQPKFSAPNHPPTTINR